MDADKLQRLKDQKTSSYRKCKAEKEEEKRQFEEDQIILEQEKEMLEQSQLKFEKEKQEMKEKYEEQKRELKDLNLSVLRAADKLEEQKCQIEAKLSVEKQEIEKRKHRLEGNWISVEVDKFQWEMEMRRIEKIKRKLECAWRVIEDEKLKLKDEKNSYVKEQKQLVAAQIEKLQDAWIRLEEEKFQLKGDKDNYLEEKRHFKVEKQEFEEKVLKCEQEKAKAHTSVCADLTEAYVPRDMFAYDESSDCLDLHITESENEEHCDGSRQLCSSSFAGCALPLIGADLEWQFNQEAANVDTLMTSLGGCVTDYRCEVSRVYDGLSVDKKCTSAISDGIVMDKHGMGTDVSQKTVFQQRKLLISVILLLGEYLKIESRSQSLLMPGL